MLCRSSKISLQLIFIAQCKEILLFNLREIPTNTKAWRHSCSERRLLDLSGQGLLEETELRGHTDAIGWSEARLSKRDIALGQILRRPSGCGRDLGGAQLPAARAWLGPELHYTALTAFLGSKLRRGPLSENVPCLLNVQPCLFPESYERSRTNHWPVLQIVA